LHTSANDFVSYSRGRNEAGNVSILAKPRRSAAKPLTRQITILVAGTQIGQQPCLGRCFVLFRIVKEKSESELSRFDNVGSAAANFASGPHGLQDTADHLPRSRAVHVVNGLGFEQLRVRKGDPQLVVQPMEQQAHVGVEGEGLAALALATGNVYIHAC
jgi:hypothetical protein